MEHHKIQSIEEISTLVSNSLKHHNVLVSGPSGVGKSYMSSMFSDKVVHLDEFGERSRDNWYIHDIPLHENSYVYEGSADNIGQALRSYNVGLLVMVVPTMPLWREMQLNKAKSGKHPVWIRGWLEKADWTERSMMLYINSKVSTVTDFLKHPIPVVYVRNEQTGPVTRGWH